MGVHPYGVQADAEDEALAAAPASPLSALLTSTPQEGAEGDLQLRELALAANLYNSGEACAHHQDHETLYNHGLVLQELAAKLLQSPATQLELLRQVSLGERPLLGVLHTCMLCTRLACKRPLLTLLDVMPTPGNLASWSLHQHAHGGSMRVSCSGGRQVRGVAAAQALCARGHVQLGCGAERHSAAAEGYGSRGGAALPAAGGHALCRGAGPAARQPAGAEQLGPRAAGEAGWGVAVCG